MTIFAVRLYGLAGMRMRLAGTLLPKLSTPSDYSVFDNGFTRQMAYKNYFMCQSVLMSVHGRKRLPW